MRLQIAKRAHCVQFIVHSKMCWHLQLEVQVSARFRVNFNESAANHSVGPGKPRLRHRVRGAGRARTHEGMPCRVVAFADLGGYGPVVVAGVRSGPSQTTFTPGVGLMAHHWVEGGLAAKPFPNRWSALGPTTGLEVVWLNHS